MIYKVFGIAERLLMLKQPTRIDHVYCQEGMKNASFMKSDNKRKIFGISGMTVLPSLRAMNNEE